MRSALVGLRSPFAAQRRRRAALWTALDVPAGHKTNGGLWWPDRDWTTVGGKVSGAADLYGANHMSQSVDARRPTAGTVNGQNAMIWPEVINECALEPAASFAPAYWMLVMRYRTGVEAVTGAGFVGLVGFTNPTRVMSEANGVMFGPSGAWTNQVSKSGGAYSSTLLPVPLTCVEIVGTPSNAGWMIGNPGYGFNRGWNGPILAAVALGIAPDTGLRQKLQGWAAHEFGFTGQLAGDHPHKTQPPRVS